MTVSTIEMGGRKLLKDMKMVIMKEDPFFYPLDNGRENASFHGI
jgi:hypothetical protein